MKVFWCQNDFFFFQNEKLIQFCAQQQNFSDFIFYTCVSNNGRRATEVAQRGAVYRFKHF